MYLVHHLCTARTLLRLFASCFFFFFFNDTATTEIYTLSLHDALPIYALCKAGILGETTGRQRDRVYADRKSTRLNSSHGYISYAVFCLKKKNEDTRRIFSMRRTITCKTDTRMYSAC